MLDLMRKHARSWFIKVALGGIIVVFIFFFGYSGAPERRRDYLAKVNDTIISQGDFQAVYNAQLEQYKRRFKGSIPQDLLEKLNLKKTVAQSLIEQALLIQEAEKLGLVITTDDLVQDIRSNPMFQQNGMFDDDIYRRQLEDLFKLSPSHYEQLRRQELLANQVASLFTDSVKTDPEEIKRFWHFQNDKLVLSMLVVKSEEDPGAAPPDQKTLENFFKENRENYRLPASLSLQYVVLSWRDLQKKLSVSKEEARDYYQLNPREFTEPEKVHAKHILVKLAPDASQDQTDEARKKAQEILARLNKGEDFEKVAREVSEDETTKEKGGDLGWLTKGSLNPQLEKVASQLEIGKVSEPVRTERGYHILTVTEKEPERQIPFELVQEKITEKLLQEKARKQVSVDADNFYELAYRKEDLEEPAKKFGLEVIKAEGVTKAGGIPEVGSDPKIMTEAFGLKTGEVSRLMKSGDNFVLLKLVDRKKERDPELDEVRSIVEKDYRKELALRNAVKKAEEIIQALRDKPNEADKIASRFGTKWDKLDPVSRTASFVPSLGNSPEVLDMLTSVTTEVPIYSKPVPATTGVAVVRLVSVERASDEQYAKEAREVEGWVREVRKTDFLRGWLRVLEEKAKIDLNEKML